MTDEAFTEHTLPNAVAWLFETNGHTVEHHGRLAGADVDLIASRQDALRSNLRTYIEVTVQYVDYIKYGKDLQKLDLYRNEPGAVRMIVSSKGFTADVIERARESGILTLTYDELFARFEQFEPYVAHVLDEAHQPLAVQLAELDSVYQEPTLSDPVGKELATAYLSDWVRQQAPENPWIMLVGEYGTGKTALTQVLQRRWMQSYKAGERDVPLPIRIELRDFVRQFDSRSLLHHFLDSNSLEDISVRFLENLISTGRAVLILDGYDEMAQFLNVRERRSCLEALASLASAGARGILTSRPNYFSEAEELRVFEVLYQRLENTRRVARADRIALESEQKVDNLLDRFFIDRSERRLKDLSAQQTEKLVRDSLATDQASADIVIDLLRRVTRTGADGSEHTLAGKPVIARYLLDVVHELANDHVNEGESGDTVGIQAAAISEWQIFDLIIQKLMLRDLRRSPDTLPADRRKFLGTLAVWLAERRENSVSEDELREIVVGLHSNDIARRAREGDLNYTESLFDDLRSSSTLDRSMLERNYRWTFSHNSLREFLLADELTLAIAEGSPLEARVPLSETVRLFARTMPETRFAAGQQFLERTWATRVNGLQYGQALSLMYEAAVARDGQHTSKRDLLASLAGAGLDVRDIRMFGLDLSSGATLTDLHGLSAQDAEFVEVDFTGANLTGANLAGSALDACQLAGADLSGVNMRGTLIVDTDISSVELTGAEAYNLDPDSTALIAGDAHTRVIEGKELLGYLQSRGAQTDPVDSYYVYLFHPDFAIFEKIARNLLTSNWSQRHGLERRGQSQKNPVAARKFLAWLVTNGMLEGKNAGDALLRPTQEGRLALGDLVESCHIGLKLEQFFKQYSLEEAESAT